VIDRRELERLREDVRRRFRKYGGRSRAWKAMYYWSHVQYRTLLVYRLAGAFAAVPVAGRLLAMVYRRLSVRSGIEFLCPIGGGVILPHFGPIKLNGRIIGDDLYVFHGVTIGDDYQTGRPVIGNNVFIGTQSSVLGAVTVGDNVVIAAHTLVTTDVPSNSLVAGNPAEIVRSIDDAFIPAMIGY
jgi:serine acetyltransferase